jgi:hypothetical protein
MRGRTWPGAVVIAALLALAIGGAGCVGSEGNTLAKDGGGPGTTTQPDSGNDNEQPDSGAGGADVSSPPVAEPDADTGDASGGCTGGAEKCSGNVPQVCISGVWQNQTACGGTKPLCSNGVCGTYIVSGGIGSTATTVGDAGTLHLVSGGFEVGARTCTAQGVCVTGGIVP